MIRGVIRLIDQLNKSIGHAFAWCIVILTLGVSFEVFVRYVLKDPTSWAFDLSFILYGALFLSEAIALNALLGLALVVVGILLANGA